MPSGHALTTTTRPSCRPPPRRIRSRSTARSSASASAEPLMATVLRPVGHEDEMSLVDHLDELRTRLLICLFSFLVLFGLAFWQSDRVLDIVNRPFNIATKDTTERGVLAKTAGFQRDIGAFAKQAQAFAD